MFEPDYRNILDCARNREAARLPLYEHIVSYKKIGEIENVDLLGLYGGDDRDLQEFFTHYCGFFKDHGYDTVSYEECITAALPGAGALGNSRVDPVIKTAEDFRNYPWDGVVNDFFAKKGRYFQALRQALPEGMKAIGGVGNGVFECVQDLVGYMNLCYLSADDPELYQALFRKLGEISRRIWERFLREYGDAFCVLRFGDDLGYKSNTMLPTEDIRRLLLPQYKAVVDLVHSYGKPFLLHSCGSIFNVMDDLIETVGIDAKHSNEDQIAPFSHWVETYGDRIGNFGGLDMDKVCNFSRQELKEYAMDVIAKSTGHGGFAIGTGNSIPDYVPTESYLNMIEIVREYRGDRAH